MTAWEELQLAGKLFGIFLLFFGVSAIVIMESAKHVELREDDPNREDDET